MHRNESGGEGWGDRVFVQANMGIDLTVRSWGILF